MVSGLTAPRGDELAIMAKDITLFEAGLPVGKLRAIYIYAYMGVRVLIVVCLLNLYFPFEFILLLSCTILGTILFSEQASEVAQSENSRLVLSSVPLSISDLKTCVSSGRRCSQKSWEFLSWKGFKK